MFGPTVNLIFAVVVTLIAALALRGRVRRSDRAIGIGFLIAVALVSFFGFRTVDRALYWTERAHIRQTPEPWMTLGYLGQSWQVPPPRLAETLGLDPATVRGLTLDEIAAARGLPVTALIEELSARLPTLPPERR